MAAYGFSLGVFAVAEPVQRPAGQGYAEQKAKRGRGAAQSRRGAS